MQNYIRKRAVKIAHHIIQTSDTVRQTAEVFGISKSTVHTVLRISVGFIGCLNMWLK